MYEKRDAACDAYLDAPGDWSGEIEVRLRKAFNAGWEARKLEQYSALNGRETAITEYGANSNPLASQNGISLEPAKRRAPPTGRTRNVKYCGGTVCLPGKGGKCVACGGAE